MGVRSAFSAEAKALWSDGRGPSLVVLATAWGLLVGARMIYPVLIPHLQRTFDISLTVAGLLVSVLWLCAAIGQLPGGILADRYDERSLLATSVLLVAVGLLFVITAPTLVLLFAATALWGLSHSLYPIARITLLSQIYAERLGSALGVTMATGDVGQTVLPPIAAILAAAFAWQVGLGFLVPALVLLALALLIILPALNVEEGGGHGPTSAGLRVVLAEIRGPNVALMSGILLLFIFLWQSFTAFYPTYLVSMKGLSPAVASGLFGFFFAVGVVVKPVAGAAYDRIGMRLSLIGVLLPAVVGLLLLPLFDNLAFLVAITALISTMLGTGAITQSYLAQIFSEDMRGTGLGIIRTGTATFGAGGPVVFGFVADTGYFDEGYIALAVLLAVVILLTFRMSDE